MSNALILIFFSFFSFFLIIFLANKFNFLIYKANNSHKDYFEKKIFNIGGSILFFYILILIFFLPKQFNFSNYNIFFFSLVFFIGLISDIKEFDAKLRLILLSLIVLIFVYLTSNYIMDFKFFIINIFFSKNLFFAYIFSSLCIIVLINGINFTDGVHGLSIFYSINVIILLNLFLFKIDSEYFYINQSLYLLPLLFLLFIANIREKIFFGDSGSYLIGVLLAIFIINQAKEPATSYPYVYANMLIYPAFEVLFSIIRKLLSKQNPLKADKRHLHHLIQNFFLFKNFSLKNSKIISGIGINFFILFFNIIAIQFYKEKFFVILIIFLFMLFYTIVYFLLKKFIKNK